MFCKHDWRKVGKVEQKYTTKNKQIYVAMCICDRCGKIKQKKLEGNIVNSII